MDGTFLIEYWSRNNIVSPILVDDDNKNLYQAPQTPIPRANADLPVQFTFYATDINRIASRRRGLLPPTKALKLLTCSQ
jgi:hypothetical protein